MKREPGNIFQIVTKLFITWLILGLACVCALVLTEAIARLCGHDWSELIFNYGWMPMIYFFLPIELLFLALLVILPKPMAVTDAAICPKCHYDLRAHHPSDKCPECGTPIPVKNATIGDERSPK